MTEDRSDHTDPGPEPNPADPESRDEESIEILEVVGLDEGGSRTPGKPAAPDAPGEDSIPYSRQELFELLRRRQAEFENARKRMEREEREIGIRVGRSLLSRLLPVLDNFERALSDSGAGAAQAFRDGVTLTVQQLRDALAREGLEEIPAVGEPFDPHLHEAVETTVVEGQEGGVVLADLRKGYRFQGQLLRPTLVRVSAKPDSEPRREV